MTIIIEPWLWCKYCHSPIEPCGGYVDIIGWCEECRQDIIDNEEKLNA